MPNPDDYEDEEDWMDACVPARIDEGDDEDQAVAACINIWDERSLKTGAKKRSNAHVVKTHVTEGTGLNFVLSDESVDRMGDMIVASGWDLKNFLRNPIVLFNHDKNQIVGLWENIRIEGKKLKATLRFAEKGTSAKIDEIRSLVEQGILRATSVGFRPLRAKLQEGKPKSKDDDNDLHPFPGIKFHEQELLEASLVAVPANANALRLAKSLGVSEETQRMIFRSGDSKQLKGAVGSAKVTINVERKEAKMAKKTIAEQIAGFEATRASKDARMKEIMNEAAEAGETLNEEQKIEYDELAQDVKSVDEHVVRLRALERSSVAKAVEVKAADPDTASRSRGTVRVEGVRSNVPKGILYARYVIAKFHGWRHQKDPVQAARDFNYFDETPELETILKAPVAVGTTQGTTWARPLVEPQFMASEFIELLTPLTIIGRIPGLRRVPFNIKIPRVTTAATVSWVGEGMVKPVSAMAFDSISLGFTKVAGIVPVTEELFRFSNPAIEALVRDSLLDAVAKLTDFDFLDPSKVAVEGVSPASITNGVLAHTASGTTADALRADLGRLLATYAGQNQNLSGLVLVMTSQMAIRFSLMRNTLGNQEFPGLGPSGGTLEGIPVVVSENIVSTGSPAGQLIIAINAPEVLLADDGSVAIDISREASLQMESAPDSPPSATTVTVSLWQHNMVGIRAERGINWMKRRAGAVQYIEGANYS